MDKNHIIGFVLIFVVMIGFTMLNRPSEEKLRQQQAVQDSIAAAQAKQDSIESVRQLKAALARAREDSIAAADTTRLLRAETGAGEEVVLRNELVEVALNTRGGVPERATLKEYNNQSGEPVELFSSATSTLAFTLPLKDDNLRTRTQLFRAENVTDSTVSMVLDSREGELLRIDYKLHAESYMVDMIVQPTPTLARHMMPGKSSLLISWTDTVCQQEKGFTFENRYSTLTYKETNGGVVKMSEVKEKDKQPEESLDWVGFKNQFFSYVLIGYDGLRNARLHSTPMERGSGYLKSYSAGMETGIDAEGVEPTRMQLYMGPNQFRLLQKQNKLSLVDGKDLDMEKLVYLGWPLFRYINRYITIYLFDWLTRLGMSMGLVLLVMTIVLKLLVFPTTRKSYMSSARMRVLKPKIDEVGAKYPNPEDAMKKQQEMMSVYSQYGVSPMGGCLPVLLQTPIWIAMFNFVPNAIELRGASFLWADDLSTYDDVISWGTQLPIIGDHLSLFCLLFCGSNLFYSWIMMRMQKNSMMQQQAQQMKMMQWMMMLMPLMFFFIFNDYSAGLNYYYFISLVCSVITMWLLRITTNDAKLLAQLEAKYERNKQNPQKTKGLAARLEALQKQQQEQLERERAKNRSRYK